MDVRTLEPPVVDPALDTRFRALLEHYCAPIVRLASLYACERADREDLVQDIWLAVWRALPGFRGDCSERTFIYRIAHNRALTRAGRRRAAAAPLEEALDIIDPGASVEDHVQAADERVQLLAALRRLSPVQRQVVLLTLEGLPQREIAQVLGIAEPNVAVRLSRARAELTRRLGGKQQP